MGCPLIGSGERSSNLTADAAASAVFLRFPDRPAPVECAGMPSMCAVRRVTQTISPPTRERVQTAARDLEGNYSRNFIRGAPPPTY
jgi:hypothetical protein